MFIIIPTKSIQVHSFCAMWCRVYTWVVNLFLYSWLFIIPQSTTETGFNRLLCKLNEAGREIFYTWWTTIGSRDTVIHDIIINANSDIISNCTVLTRLSDARQLCRINLWSSSIIADNVIIITPHQRYIIPTPPCDLTWLSPIWPLPLCLMPLRKSIGVSGLCEIMYSNSHPADR